MATEQTAQNATGANSGTDAEAKEAKKSRAYFVTSSGEASKNPSEDVTHVQADFPEGFDVVKVALEDFNPTIRTYLAWHGLKQLVGDSRADEKKKGVETVYDNLVARIERLLSGDWVKERESAGPRISMIVQAIANAKAAEGDPLDEARLEGVREKMKTKENRERAMANPVINMHYEQLRTEAQQKRLEKARAAAEGATLGEF